MKKLWLVIASVMSFTVFAGTPDFRNLTADDVDRISEEFHANFVPTTISGASNMGRLWGFEVGLVASRTDVPEIKKESNDDFSELYNAALFGRLDVIYGLGAEVTMMPLSLGSLEFKTYSLGFKWTLTEVFKAIPFNIKLRAYYNTANIKYEDSNSFGDTDIEYDLDAKGVDVTFSKKILLVEPYVGIGYVEGESDLRATGTGAAGFFGPQGVAQGNEYENVKSSGMHYFAGVRANLIAIDVGLEYARILGKDRISAKLGFGF